ncbi:helix-turn-helix domain-containing protein [Moraxella marmotae]|uniref:helix-turn-helix domain-containing protein n=1 Tax=Moraxella marmotae TaxID=3344520 RepID=UPI0035D4BD0B
MKTNEKIRLMREAQNWTQEDLAEKLGMSVNSYAKLERGESRIYLGRLEKISEVFQVELSDLLSNGYQAPIWLTGDNNNHHNMNYYGNADNYAIEIETLKLSLKHKDELLAQKDYIIEQHIAQIQLLKQLLETKSKD